jgi:tRNA modification GTPase
MKTHPANALLQTIGVVIAFLGVIAVQAIVPQFQDVFESFGAELPAITQMFVRGRWLLWPLPLAVPMIAAFVRVRDEDDRRRGIVGLIVGIAIGVGLPFFCTIRDVPSDLHDSRRTRDGPHSPQTCASDEVSNARTRHHRRDSNRRRCRRRRRDAHVRSARIDAIAHALCGKRLKPRYAHYARFRDERGETIDDGIALYFRAPASYTGEDVVELQAHGSPAVLRALLDRCCALGARPARAGEFSERAFLNGKLDLAQAEAVADLIAAADLRAARAARRSLDGVFSQRVDALAAALLRLRIHVEATIDFVDESIEALGGSAIEAGLAQAHADLEALLREAERGQKLRDGLHAVIVGPPNAGKSSLLNALAGSDRAIVSEIAGTTRDLLRETVRVDGLELTLVDTAGLRAGGDVIEREGMRRAEGELRRADLAIVVLDARDLEAGRSAVAEAIADVPQRLWVANKADLLEFQGVSAALASASSTEASPEFQSEPASPIAIDCDERPALGCRRAPASVSTRCMRDCRRWPARATAPRARSPRARGRSTPCVARGRNWRTPAQAWTTAPSS